MRRYAERLTKTRLHQRVFRSQVLLAYAGKCAICHLKHSELLDAAHIIADGQPNGEPVVPNGLSLCKIHHAAFDHKILGIRPDLTLHVRQDVLEEIDGWMLRGGIQGVHDKRLEVLPESVPHDPTPVVWSTATASFSPMSRRPAEWSVTKNFDPSWGPHASRSVSPPLRPMPRSGLRSWGAFHVCVVISSLLRERPLA